MGLSPGPVLSPLWGFLLLHVFDTSMCGFSEAVGGRGILYSFSALVTLNSKDEKEHFHDT